MPSPRRTAALLAGPALAVLAATSVVAGPSSAPHASGTFVDARGVEIGWLRLTEDRDGIVHVNVHVKGLSAGLHGIHIHAIGACSPDFAAAGGHYNPLGAQHGLDNPLGPHLGDLPNLIVNEDGIGHLDAKTDRVTLSEGTSTLFDADGSAFIIHANMDNQTTDVASGGPANGNSGARIACARVVED
jgi:superoxide dismutase, Cu-Zn family